MKELGGDENKQEDEEIPFDENPLEDSRLLDYEDEDFDSEVKKLVSWSEALDFDKYVEEWSKISTSLGSEYR